jgi:hypothetical protein
MLETQETLHFYIDGECVAFETNNDMTITDTDRIAAVLKIRPRVTASVALHWSYACDIVRLIRPHYLDRHGRPRSTSEANRDAGYDEEYSDGYDAVSGCLFSDLLNLDLETLTTLLRALTQERRAAAL